MAAFLKLKSSILRLKSCLHLQRFNHTLVESVLESELYAELGPKLMVASDCVDIDTSKWKRLDSRTLGITMSMIPDSSRIVLRILQNEGHDAYFVGGCVRDLLLNKIPKDFDVITTANLLEIKKKFHRAFIVGRRFPICKVHVRGSTVEVSSFETVARDAIEKDDLHLSKVPKGYDEKDLMRWKNSLHRDFTINSLFFDPFAHKIYDYSSGMADLTSMKLRTLVPAHLSFQEDCARILRGLRIAARLGLSFAKDTEKAMCKQYSSIKTLDKGRLMMEMNYMLSYGAAEPSLLLLKRFNLLEILLPFHAAYLRNHSGVKTPLMLMKLFYSMDSVVSCDQPCDPILWISLLAFHHALVNNPQDALVVCTLSSVLYHGKWKEGVKTARALAGENVVFVPEISENSIAVTDEDLAQKVAKFGSTILDSIDALTDSESLQETMDRYPFSPCSGLVFISKNAGHEAAKVFSVLLDDIVTLRNERHSYGIDYMLLRKGDIEETRFVLGKVIMDTIRGGASRRWTKLLAEKKNLHISKSKAEQGEAEKPSPSISELETQAQSSNDKVKRVLDVSDDPLPQQKPKKQKKNNSAPDGLKQKLSTEKLEESPSCEGFSKINKRLKKVVVKDVEKLLSGKVVAAKKDEKLGRGKQGKARSSKKIQFVLESVPNEANQLQKTQTHKKIVALLEMANETANQHKAQAVENVLSVLGNTPKVGKTQEEVKTSTKVSNVPKLSTLFGRKKKQRKSE